MHDKNSLLRLVVIASFAVTIFSTGILVATPVDVSAAPAAVKKAKDNSKIELNKAVQRALARKGYKVGKIDGVMGRKTRLALKYYQRAEGLHSELGRIGPKTKKRMGIR